MTGHTYSINIHTSNIEKSSINVNDGMTDYANFTEKCIPNREQSSTKVTEDPKIKSPYRKPTKIESPIEIQKPGPNLNPNSGLTQILNRGDPNPKSGPRTTQMASLHHHANMLATTSNPNGSIESRQIQSCCCRCDVPKK